MVSCQEEVPSCPYGAQTMLESCYNIGAVVIRIGWMVYYTIITMCHLSCCGFGLSFAFGRLILHVQRFWNSNVGCGSCVGVEKHPLPGLWSTILECFFLKRTILKYKFILFSPRLLKSTATVPQTL